MELIWLETRTDGKRKGCLRRARSSVRGPPLSPARRPACFVATQESTESWRDRIIQSGSPDFHDSVAPGIGSVVANRAKGRERTRSAGHPALYSFGLRSDCGRCSDPSQPPKLFLFFRLLFSAHDAR